MKGTNLFLATLLLLLFNTNSKAQLWGGAGSPTWTAGNVGIGTGTTPTDAWLHINGLLQNIPCGGGGSTFANVTPELWLDRQTCPGCLSRCSPPAQANIFQVSRTSSYGGPGYTTIMDVIDDNGNLGILTASPAFALDVHGDGAINNFTVNGTATIGIANVTLNVNTGPGGDVNCGRNVYAHGGMVDMTHPGSWSNINGGASNYGLFVKAGTTVGPSADGAYLQMFGNAGGAPGGADIIATGALYSGTSFFYANGSSVNENVSVFNSGKVVIGNGIITTPGAGTDCPATPAGYLLYVEEGILTDRLKVASHGSSDWSDFVFNSNYDLMPLYKVESFVKENKHLPEIPSASEVAKDGIDVARMDAKLLQKIEELTLYAIQQQKQLEEQKNEIELLKKKMN